VTAGQEPTDPQDGRDPQDRQHPQDGAGPVPEEGAGPVPGGVGGPGETDDVEEWLAAGAPDDGNAPAEPAADEVEQESPEAGLQRQLAERTADLQRLQAEFVNYKRRVERDRELLAQNAAYKALAPIVEVLDTIERAREHGEVEGGFKSVADQLERTVAASGLVRFGAVGDAFDPTVHEALSSMGPDPEGAATVTTVKVVAKAGYKIGDRVVRAAQVLTVEPA